MRQAATWLVLGLVLSTSVLAGACRGDEPEAAAPTPTTAATSTTPTVVIATAMSTPSLEEEVSAAYLAYWDAYAQAVLELEPELVEGFATGEELERIREEISAMQEDNVALRVAVEHDFAVVSLESTEATVVDRVVNNSFYVDPITLDPPTAEGSGEVVSYTFLMTLVGGQWLVSGGFAGSGGG